MYHAVKVLPAYVATYRVIPGEDASDGTDLILSLMSGIFNLGRALAAADASSEQSKDDDDNCCVM
jgi:hypothetical protein